jgi:hypothetical protein
MATISKPLFVCYTSLDVEVSMLLYTNGWKFCSRWTYFRTLKYAEALCYKPEVQGFESSWDHWIFLHWPNPSSRTVALGLTRSLTEKSSMNVRWVGGRSAGA